MGLFSKIFGSGKAVAPRALPDYKTLTAYSPTFTSYNGQIYESELVRAAIHAKATHISKLKVEISGRGAQYLQNRLRKPNEFQTWSQFLYRLATIFETENSAFIVPGLSRDGRVREIYPILPSRCKMVEVQGEPWMAFEFRDGHVAQSPINKVGVMTKFQYRNDFFGEDNKALRSTMALMDIQNQAITEGVKSAATYRFMAQYNNLAFDDDLKKEQDRFNAQVSGDGGMAILFPNTYQNIQQINSKPFVIDAEQMKLIQTSVFQYFNVNADILEGRSYGDQWVAFYETAVEPFAIQLSEVLTDLFINCGELSGDCSVMATANRLQYMSNKEKLEVSAQLADRGVLNRDEVREIWNLPPLPGGEGQAYIIRGEYKNADDQVNENEGDEENAGEA